ncbi:hypothetical protein SCP_0104350 [Sparassis crispa]|uniref:Uncharacterized protein n=1 Tax=Sparassis crispa TaxID=139825 RepID=A0A401G5Y8_9APHY|nr:hypothetical protein SCP_0104350 [Sparassis crispa]GBE77557.1 hypothetical protein SCP_0104350 [Sparassis crispa]
MIASSACVGRHKRGGYPGGGEKILEKEGRIDIIVNNAGVVSSAPLIDVPMELVLNTFNTNAFSVLRVARVVIPHMAERRSGTIVNISPIVGETPMPWSGIYASSKTCVTTLSEVLYMECMPFNISHASHPWWGQDQHLGDDDEDLQLAPGDP